MSERRRPPTIPPSMSGGHPKRVSRKKRAASVFSVALVPPRNEIPAVHAANPRTAPRHEEPMSLSPAVRLTRSRVQTERAAAAIAAATGASGPAKGLSDEQLHHEIDALVQFQVWGWRIAELNAEVARRDSIRLHAAIGTPAGSRYYE